MVKVPTNLMKSLTEYLTFKTKSKKEFINITPDVEKLVQKSTIKEGICLVNAMHITASVFINDNESGLHHDYDKWLEELAPHTPIDQYRHNDTCLLYTSPSPRDATLSRMQSSA